jgi:hypothetical protein
MLKKNEKLTLLDNSQILRSTFDEENNAQRVILIGSDGFQITESIKESLKDLKIEVIATEQQKIPFIAPEIKIIEIPKIIKELEIREVEKVILVPEYRVIEIETPIIVKELQIVEVEKLVLQTEIKFIEVPIIPKAFLLLILGMQVLLSLLTLIKK